MHSCNKCIEQEMKLNRITQEVYDQLEKEEINTVECFVIVSSLLLTASHAIRTLTELDALDGLIIDINHHRSQACMALTNENHRSEN